MSFFAKGILGLILANVFITLGSFTFATSPAYATVTACTGTPDNMSANTYFIIDTDAASCLFEVGGFTTTPTNGFIFRVDEDDLHLQTNYVGGLVSSFGGAPTNITSHTVSAVATGSCTVPDPSPDIAPGLGIYDNNINNCTNDTVTYTVQIVKSGIPYDFVVNLTGVTEGPDAYTISSFTLNGGSLGSAAPTPTITTGGITTFNESTLTPFTATVTFDESVSGFSNGELTATNATVGGLVGAGTTYTATITPNGGGNVALNVASSVVQAVSGGANNVAATQVTVTQTDDVDPTVVVNIVDTSLSDTDNSSNVTFEFSETVNSFIAGDLTVVGGTISAFAFVDGDSYTATFTATDGSTTSGSVTVDALSYTDTAANTGAAGSDTVTVDTANPTVTVNIVDASLNDTDNSSNVTFEFSETVASFVVGDLTIVGGTISAFTSVDGDSYTATFTATDGSTTGGSVTVDALSYTDVALNTGATGSDTVTVDTLNPTVTVNIADTGLNIADNSSNVTFEFSETVASFVVGDLTVVGGTISAFASVDGDSYTATFTATNGSTTGGSVTVDALSYTDVALNTGASGSDTVTINTANPTVTVDIVDTSLSDTDNSSSVTFEFSETVSGFAVGDLTVVGGAISAFASVDGDSYTATFTATDGSTTTGSVTVDAASYTNAAFNTGATGSDTVTVNTVNPTVTVNIVDTSLSDTDNSSNVTFEFSETVASFVVGDLTIVGGTISAFASVDGDSYTATFTATDGSTTTGSVTVDAASYTNAAFNTGATGSDTVTVNTVNPSVTVNIVDNSLSDTDNSSNVTFEFSETVSGFAVGDLTVVGGTISAFTLVDGDSYTATFTAPNGSTTTGSVTVDASSYTDVALNTGATGSDTVTVDTVNPTVTVDIVDTSLNDADNSSSVTFEFSETVASFVVGDLTVVGGTISAFASVDGDSYTATFTATDGSTTTGSVTVDASSYTDTATNTGATGSDTVTVNTVNPTVTVDIVDASLSDSDLVSSVTFEFSETVSGFVVGDLTVVGGTISAFASVDGDSYTATFTAPNGSTTTGSVTVDASSYTNAALNTGTTGSDTVSINTANPTVTVDIVDASLSDTDNSSNVTFEFSETVSGFAVGDLTVVGGTISAFASVDGDSYTATFTATDNSTTTGSVTVDAASYTNAALNTGTAGSDTVTVDTVNPTVTVDIVDTALSDTDNSSSVTFEFSETVSGFAVGDLTVVGGTISAFTLVDGDSYTATFTATDNSTTSGSVTVNASSYTDTALNTGATGSDTVTVDTISPTVTITTGGTTSFNASSLTPFTVTATFSESIMGFADGELTATNATVGTIAGSGAVYTFVITPAGTGDIVISVAGSVAFDSASNNNTAATQVTVTQTDDVGPTATITTDAVGGAFNLSAPGTFTATITFSEVVTGFVTGELTATNASLAAISGSGTTYTAVVTPAGTGDVLLNVAGSVAIDGASNNNIAAPQLTVTQTNDLIPNVVITTNATGGAFSQGSPGTFTATVTFSKPVTGFIDGELTATNASLASLSGTGTTYTAVVTPAGTGNVLLDVAGGVAIDGVSNNNTAAAQVAVTQTDDVGPRIVSIERQTPTSASTSADTLVWRVTFDENAIGVDATDFSVAGTTATVTLVTTITASTVFDVTVSGGDLANLEGTVTLTVVVASGNIQDALSNNFTNATPTTTNDNVFTISNDTTQPTVSILNAPETHDRSTPFNVTIEFSEDVTGFILDDISVDKGGASNFIVVDANTYTADITPSGVHNITLDVAAAVAFDYAANSNIAATQVTIKSTIVSETQTVIADFMSSRARQILNNQPDMIGFITGVNNQGGGPLGFLQLESDLNNQTTMSFYTSRSKILAEQDEATRGKGDRLGYGEAQNPSANLASVERFGLIDDEQPALETGQLNTELANNNQDDAQNFNGKDRTGTWDIWTKVYGAKSSQSTISSNFWSANIGTHYFVNNDLLIGLITQFDWASETNSTTNSKVEGNGFMVGPYIAGKIKEQNLYYEARALWGKSSNDVTPIGTYTDNFKTERWLASVKIEGAYNIGDQVMIKPAASLSYFEETQNQYTDTNAFLIPEQTISVGEFKFGPTITRSFDVGSGFTMRTSVGVSGVVNFGVRNANTSTNNAFANEDARARFDAGIELENEYGIRFTAAGYYDGVGTSDYESFGGELGLVIPIY